MPQLSLYLNSNTMSLLREDATKVNKSLSNYVSELINERKSKNAWPKDYWENIYGALKDESFQVPPELDACLDGALPEF